MEPVRSPGAGPVREQLRLRAARCCSLRTGEIGVRIALGATGRRVVAEIVREAAIVAAAGVVTGWAVAVDLLPAGRPDPAVFAGVPAALMGVAAFAAWVAARRAAAAVDPLSRSAGSSGHATSIHQFTNSPIHQFTN
jgi:hypothetical protein